MVSPWVVRITASPAFCFKFLNLGPPNDYLSIFIQYYVKDSFPLQR